MKNDKEIKITTKQKALADRVYQTTADKYCIDIKLMRSNRRPEEIVKARFLAWQILSKKYGWSNTQIARVCKKYRSTIVYGLRKVAKIKI